jgi:hypothetical protein
MEFKTLQELYNRVKPALITKCNEMRRLGFTYIQEEDIWNFLKENKWINARNLGLSEMVDDILNTDNKQIDKYVKDKLTLMARHANLEEDQNGRG